MTGSVYFNGAFRTYDLYFPPGSSKYVPLFAYYWSCNGSAYYGSPQWSVFDSPSPITGPSNDIVHPTWTTVVTP